MGLGGKNPRKRSIQRKQAVLYTKIQESAAYRGNKLCCTQKTSEDPNNPEDRKTKKA
jgi:hypothetical protein